MKEIEAEVGIDGRSTFFFCIWTLDYSITFRSNGNGKTKRNVLWKMQIFCLWLMPFEKRSRDALVALNASV